MTPKHEGIDAYVAKRPEPVAALLQEMRAFIHQVMPGTTESMQYGAPVFSNAQGVPVIYLYGAKSHVNFGFLKSAELEDPDGILKGSGTPSKHIKLAVGAPVDTAMLAGFIEQCARISA